MKRHNALIPLTHDHHHALAQARRLRRSAAGDDADRLDRARDFLEFFSKDTLQHFREEEEEVFPLLVERAVSPPEVLVQILIEHVRIHALVRRLQRQVEAGRVEGDTLHEIGELLQSHIRLEEGTLFPIIEEVVSDEDLGTVTLATRNRVATQA